MIIISDIPEVFGWAVGHKVACPTVSDLMCYNIS